MIARATIVVASAAVGISVDYKRANSDIDMALMRTWMV